MPDATFAIDTTFSEPYYSGAGGVSADVPGKFPIAVAGHAYLLDDADTQNWRDQSIPMLKQLYDPNPTPSEASINAEGLWRRAQDTWHLGAGQTYRDRDANGLSERFRSSKGINPWTKYQVSLLYDTTKSLVIAGSNTQTVSAGSRLYVVDGTILKYTTDLSAYTTTSAGSGVAINNASLASDGFHVWVGVGASGIYQTDTSSSAQSQLVSDTVGGPVAYVKGRLMCANGASIYNITSTVLAAKPTALFTHGNSNFAWVGFAEGRSQIYAAGFSGDKSWIYKTAVKTDGSALDAPSVAGELPDGEIVRSIQGYLGYILLGTDKGWRFCVSDGQGNLNIGARVNTPGAVFCFEGQDRYVWFGWTNYDSTSSGLGRMDLTNFTEGDANSGGVPAYASDLMATAQGTVRGVATFAGTPVFTVDAVGLYSQSANRVASGTLDTGVINFTLPDPKSFLYADVAEYPLPVGGTIAASLAVDDGTFMSIGSSSTVSDTFITLNCNQVVGKQAELRFTLTFPTDNTASPTLRSWRLKATAGAHDGPNEYMHRPLLFHRELMNAQHNSTRFDPSAEVTFIKGLRQTRSLISLVEYSGSYTGLIEDFEWIPIKPKNDQMSGKWSFPDGTMVIKFKRIV